MKKLKIGVLMAAICVCLFSALNVSAAETVVDPHTAVENANANYGYFSSFKYDVTANIITITAQAPENKKYEVMVSVKENTTNKDIVLKQFKSSSTGYISVSFVLNPELYASDAANTATLRVAANGVNICKAEGIKLFSESELNALAGFTLTVNDEATLETFLNASRNVLGISELDSANNPQDAYNIEMLWSFIEQYHSGANAPATLGDVINMSADIFDKLNRANELLGLINAEAQNDTVNGNEIQRLLTGVTAYSDIVFDQSGVRVINKTQMYARLGRDAQGEKAVYHTIAELKTAFDSAAAAQENADRQIGGMVLDSGADFKADAWKVNAVANVVMISGALDRDDDKADMLTVYVTDRAGSRIILVQQAVTNTDGTFSLTLPLNAAKFNDLIAAGSADALYVDLFISAEGYDKWQFYIPVYNGADVTDMLNAFRTGISSVADMTNFFTTYRKIHGIGDGYTSEMYNLLYAIYSENDYTGITNGYGVATAVVGLNNTMNNVRSFLSDFNIYSKQGRWGKMMSTIQTTHESLKNEFGQYNTLLNKVKLAEGLTPAQQQDLFIRMSGVEYSDVASISSAFDAAYAIVTTPPTPPTPPTPGGTGGGNRDVTIGSGNGNNGGDTGNSGDVGNPAVDKDKLPSAPFTDITEDYNWAKTSIDGLRQKSIIHGDGDGQFRPAAQMTREEYLKTLLGAYGIAIKGGANSFADVKADEWYTDVITTAYGMGIVNGVGEGKFGIGQSVTRADMVVMAARTAEALGIDITQKQQAKIFKDYDTIPEYAYNYVVAFQQAGFISGDEVGRFNPQNAVTRAEAAVLFWSIVQYTGR